MGNQLGQVGNHLEEACHPNHLGVGHKVKAEGGNLADFRMLEDILAVEDKFREGKDLAGKDIHLHMVHQAFQVLA